MAATVTGTTGKERKDNLIYRICYLLWRQSRGKVFQCLVSANRTITRWVDGGVLSVPLGVVMSKFPFFSIPLLVGHQRIPSVERL